MKFSGTAAGGSNPFSGNYEGQAQLTADGYEGNGNWSGTMEGSSGQVAIGGTWEIHKDPNPDRGVGQGGACN